MNRRGAAGVLALAAWGIAGGALARSAAAAPGSPHPAIGDFALVGPPVQGGWLRGVAPPGTMALTLDGRPVPVAADGTFFIAFDRDAPPASMLVADASGRRIAHPLAIAPRGWEIETVDTPKKPDGVPDADYLRLRTAELAQITEARAVDHVGDGWRQPFVWPATGRISGKFGAQRIYRGGEAGAYHSGVDIAVGAGTPFVAPADGVVILAADHPFTLEGNLLMIDHGMGLNSAFLHGSAILVKVGDGVRQGQVIGRVGMTGRATGPHLHWSLKWRDARLDPMLFAGDMARATPHAALQTYAMPWRTHG